ncbi:MAG: DUF2165 family protein [Hyphomicrobiales bacterium]
MKTYYRLIILLYTFALALYFSLIVFNNLADYNSNFLSVKGILDMSEVIKDSIAWRSIESPYIHHTFYILIIIFEFIIAVLYWIGFIDMIRTFRRSWIERPSAFKWVSASSFIVLLIFLLGFVVIGGEFFLSYRSATINSVIPGMRISTIIIFYIILQIPYLSRMEL